MTQEKQSLGMYVHWCYIFGGKLAVKLLGGKLNTGCQKMDPAYVMVYEIIPI